MANLNHIQDLPEPEPVGCLPDVFRPTGCDDRHLAYLTELYRKSGKQLSYMINVSTRELADRFMISFGSAKVFRDYWIVAVFPLL